MKIESQLKQENELGPHIRRKIILINERKTHWLASNGKSSNDI